MVQEKNTRRHTVTLCLFAWALIVIMFGGFLATRSHAENSDGSIDIRFRGTLSAGACVLDSLSEDITVEFPDMPSKFFRLYNKGPERRFQLRLTECDIGRTVQVQFRGVGASAVGLEGTLKLNSSTSGLDSQLGIQLAEYINGHPRILTLSSGSSSGAVTPLTQLTEILTFGAWLKPSAAILGGATVTPGAYNAVAAFDLIYD